MDDREQVRLAALYLDEIKPGWWANIDPIRLDMGGESTCICGQNGLNWREHWQEMAKRFGEETACFAANWLEPLWLEEIAERMPAREPVPA